MEDVIEFLKNNGFKKIEKNSYANEVCNIIITPDGYEVANNEGWVRYSNDFNIYWLIGILIYYEYIDKAKLIIETE